MAETQQAAVESSQEKVASRRNEKVGAVVSTKMDKTIVVKVEMAKAHPKYKRVMRTARSFMRTTRRTRPAWAMWFVFARRARCRS
jgi:small subunit ribosomal protein S17